MGTRIIQISFLEVICWKLIVYPAAIFSSNVHEHNEYINKEKIIVQSNKKRTKCHCIRGTIFVMTFYVGTKTNFESSQREEKTI